MSDPAQTDEAGADPESIEMTTGPEPVGTNTDPEPTEREVHSAGSKIRSILGVAVVAVTGLFIVIYALPDSPIRSHIPLWVFHTGDALSLNQNWALFAPDPPTTDVQLDVVVTDADGAITVESLPTGPVWVPTVRSERWRKVRERVTPTSGAARWPEVLQWSLRQLRSRGRDPQRIELRRRWIERRADDPDDRGTERTFPFARLEVSTDTYVVLDPDAPGAVKNPPVDDSPDGRAKESDQ